MKCTLMNPMTAAWALLRAIEAGKTLAEIGDRRTASAMTSIAVLPACVQRGWIAGFELADVEPYPAPVSRI